MTQTLLFASGGCFAGAHVRARQVGRTAVGAIELDEDDARDDALTPRRRELRVLGRLETEDAEREFVILWVERA
jgi:hypothetical protein